MKQKDKFTIEITKDEVTQALSARLTYGNNSKNLVETIIGVACTTEMGLELIYKAIQGWERKFDFKEGQNILIPIDNLYTWKMNKEATKNNPKCAKDGNIKAIVTEIDEYARECYKVSYTYIDDKGEEQVQENFTSDGRVFLLPDSFPFDE